MAQIGSPRPSTLETLSLTLILKHPELFMHLFMLKTFLCPFLNIHFVLDFFRLFTRYIPGRFFKIWSESLELVRSSIDLQQNLSNFQKNYNCLDKQISKKILPCLREFLRKVVTIVPSSISIHS